MLAFTNAATEQILETALDAIIIMDEDHLVHAWNASAEEVFGYLKKDALGRFLYDLIIPSEFVAMHRAGVKRYIETGKSDIIGKRIEIVALRADRALICIELAVHVIGNTTRPCFIARCRDITERKELLEQLNDANKTLHHWVGNTLQIISATLRLQGQDEARETIEKLSKQYRIKFNLDGPDL